MGSMTNFLEVELLDHTLNKAAWSPPATVYLGLCTADPTDAATGASANEVANANGYQRTAISFAAATGRSITQSGAVNFPQASGGGWGTATHYALFTSQTYGGGDCIGHGSLSASKTINDGNTPSVADGECVISIGAGEVSNYLANIWLDFAFRNQAFTSPTTYLAAIITNTVTDSMTGSTITEPSGGSYARKLVYENGGGSPAWDLAVSGDPSYVDNGAAIQFAQATGDWGTVIAFALCDASSGGNMLMYDNDPVDQSVLTGDTINIAIGSCDWQLN